MFVYRLRLACMHTAAFVWRDPGEEHLGDGQDGYEEVRGAVRGHVPQDPLQGNPRETQGHGGAYRGRNNGLLDATYTYLRRRTILL